MKAQIDTQNKTIKVEENVNLKEFEKQFEKIKDGLKAMGEDWEKYSLITNTVIYNWNTYPVYYTWPTYWTPIYCSGGTTVLNTASNTTTLTAIHNPSLYASANTFNLELN